MICAQLVDVNGVFYVVADQQNPASPGCAFVLITPGELSPWQLSVEHAAAIAASIGVLWGLAFVLRTFVRFIQYTR